MKNMRHWGWAVLFAALTSIGCCSWAERNCPHYNQGACAPNNCCQPCAPSCCPPPANYQPSGGWSNPTGAAQPGCCGHY